MHTTTKMNRARDTRKSTSRTHPRPPTCTHTRTRTRICTASRTHTFVCTIMHVPVLTPCVRMCTAITLTLTLTPPQFRVRRNSCEDNHMYDYSDNKRPQKGQYDASRAPTGPVRLPRAPGIWALVLVRVVSATTSTCTSIDVCTSTLALPVLIPMPMSIYNTAALITTTCVSMYLGVRIRDTLRTSTSIAVLSWLEEPQRVCQQH